MNIQFQWIQRNSFWNTKFIRIEVLRTKLNSQPPVSGTLIGYWLYISQWKVDSDVVSNVYKEKRTPFSIVDCERMAASLIIKRLDIEVCHDDQQRDP